MAQEPVATVDIYPEGIRMPGETRPDKPRYLMKWENIERTAKGLDPLPDTLKEAERLHPGLHEQDVARIMQRHIKDAVTQNQQFRLLDQVTDEALKLELAYTSPALKKKIAKVYGDRPGRPLFVTDETGQSVINPKLFNEFLERERLTEISVGKNKSIYVNKDLGAWVKTIQTPGAIGAWTKSIRKINRMWAPIVLLTPGYHWRNLQSNQILLLQQFGPEALGPVRNHQAMKMVLYGENVKGSWRMKGKGDVPLPEIREVMNERNIWGTPIEGQYGVVEPGMSFSKIGKFFRRLDPRVLSNKLGTSIENQAKAVAFMTALDELPADILFRKGAKKGERVLSETAIRHATERVANTIFNYARLSNTEIATLKTLFPFYSWQSKNTSLQVKMLAKYPHLYRHWIRSQMYMPGAETRPDYEVRLGTFTLGESGPLRMGARLDWPMSDIARLGSAKELAGSLSPAIRAVVELTTGKDWRGAPLLRDPEGPSLGNLWTGVDLPHYIKKKFGGPLYHKKNIEAMIKGVGEDLERLRQFGRLTSFATGGKLSFWDVNRELQRQYERIASEIEQHMRLAKKEGR
jgi:hypothetical protein